MYAYSYTAPVFDVSAGRLQPGTCARYQGRVFDVPGGRLDMHARQLLIVNPEDRDTDVTSLRVVDPVSEKCCHVFMDDKGAVVEKPATHAEVDAAIAPGAEKPVL